MYRFDIILWRHREQGMGSIVFYRSGSEEALWGITEWIFVLLQSLMPRRGGEEGNGMERLVAKREGGRIINRLGGGGSCFDAEYIISSSIYILFVFTCWRSSHTHHTPCPVWSPLTNIGGQSEAGAYRWGTESPVGGIQECHRFTTC
jgi:hypothetical protein